MKSSGWTIVALFCLCLISCVSTRSGSIGDSVVSLPTDSGTGDSQTVQAEHGTNTTQKKQTTASQQAGPSDLQPANESLKDSCDTRELQSGEEFEEGEDARDQAKKLGKMRRMRLALDHVGHSTIAKISTLSSTESGFDEERLWSNYVDWEPALAVDRYSSNVYQMTTRYGVPQCERGCADPAIIFRRSSDGGNTWGPDQYVLKTVGAQNDPELEVSGDGTLYAALMLNYIPGVAFIKSTDQGATWSSPIPMTGPGTHVAWSDKPMLAVSLDGKDVYIAFNQSHSFIAASHDHGESFAAPVKTNRDRRYWFHTGAAVAPNGDVYFTAVDFSQDYRGEANINVIRSTDGGLSWSTTRLDVSQELPPCAWLPGCYFGFFGPQAAVAVDPDGTVMVAYNASDLDGAPQALYVRTSTDGVNWSQRIQISTPSNSIYNLFPAIVSGNSPGDFRVAWMDDRLASTEAFNVWYRQTTDGGNTWSEDVRLSDREDGAPYKSSSGFVFPYGDYFELGVDSEGATHAIWGEGASYDGIGGCWYTRGH